MFEVAWLLGWAIALLVLLHAGFNFARGVKSHRGTRSAYLVFFVTTAVLLAGLAQQAIRRHDIQFDLTRDKVFTPDPAALEVVTSLQQPVDVYYFGHEEDAAARRNLRCHPFSRL